MENTFDKKYTCKECGIYLLPSMTIKGECPEGHAITSPMSDTKGGEKIRVWTSEWGDDEVFWTTQERYDEHNRYAMQHGGKLWHKEY